MSFETNEQAERVTWDLDPTHSSVGFAIRHLMISTVRGRFGNVKGSIVTDESNPGSATVLAELVTASIDTGDVNRDAHLRSGDFLDAEKNPLITFQSTAISGNASENFKLVGLLSISGVTREVVIDVTTEGRGMDPWGGERAAFSATTKLKRSDFGLTWNQALETGGVVVGDEVKISIDVELVKRAPVEAMAGA